MRYRTAILMMFLAGIQTAPAFAQVRPQTPPQSPQAEPQEEPRPVLAVPPGYHYEARGRRDPFVNPIPKPQAPEPEVQTVRPPGVKGALVSEVIVAGVFVAKDDPAMTRAILQIPGLKAPVIVSRGEVLFDAVIKEVRPDSVVFTLLSPGIKPDSPSENREVVKKLRSTAGEKK